MFVCIPDISISMYQLDQDILSHPWQIHFYVSTLPKYSFASSTPASLRICSTRMFYRILDTSISSYLLDRNILSHPQQLHFIITTRPQYSIASSTPQFLRTYSTRKFFASLTTPFLRTYLTETFYRILDTSISSYQLDQNIRSHPPQATPFLRIYSTRIFHRILNNSISTYLLDQNILSYPWNLHFIISTQPKYSFASVTPPFLRINSTKIFIRIPDISIFTYWPRYTFASMTPPFLCIYSTKILIRILNTSISSYLLLDQTILSHPRHLPFFISTRPGYSIASSTPPFLRIYLTRIFYCILNNSISLYLLNRNILSDPWHVNAYVSTRPEYSIASSTTPILRINSTRIFDRIVDNSISTYQLDHNIRSHPWHIHFYIYLLDQYILSHPQHINFYVPTRPKYSCASPTFEFLCIYSTKIFLRIPDTSISTYLHDQNIIAHPWFFHFYVHVTAQPKYSCAHSIPPFLRIYSTIIFLLTLDSSISTYLLDQDILAHPWFLYFYVSSWP